MSPKREDWLLALGLLAFGYALLLGFCYLAAAVPS